MPTPEAFFFMVGVEQSETSVRSGAIDERCTRVDGQIRSVLGTVITV